MRDAPPGTSEVCACEPDSEGYTIGCHACCHGDYIDNPEIFWPAMAEWVATLPRATEEPPRGDEPDPFI